ncbi:probable tubulin polyglutamylase TTLL9 isoform X4 [Ictalurus furcatus]|uniref:probable tubulin polyglutamylase TTLL9 isoform X4 n=1 Tax=Ictalurus furcatus TaxID=66913 RepID=UPI002350F945|nr:probable tubulin polyglutamylase TTLL9 isoform X4 [Ictalurus furcatus]
MSKNKAVGYKGAYGYQKRRDGEGRSCVRFRCSLTNTILDVLHQRPGWVEVKDSFLSQLYRDGEWDFNWCDVGWLRENFDHTYMEEHVRICHFRNHYELTRKNLLVKNLKRYRKTLDREAGRQEAAKCDFFPRTFELPSEYHLFVEEFKRSPGNIWIMKPVARSQGKGIFLFRKLKDIMEWKKGCKWQMQQLRRYLTAKHGRETVEALFNDIYNIFIRSLQSVQKVIINDKHCFELYGYDILLDQDLKPWLLEVNASPSLTASSQEDYELKYRLLEDTLHVVDMEGCLTGREKQVGGFDLMWNDGPVYREDVSLEALGSTYQIANTHLGCVNDRKKQLQQLLKPHPGQKRI